MAAKPEASAAAAAKDAVAVAAPAATGAPVSAAPARGALAAWLPVIAALVLSPVATWATVQFVLLPQMQKKLVAPAATDAAKGAEGGEAEGGKGHAGKASAAPGYEFNSVVVNLSGTMGTRYLKTTFLVTGPDADIKGIFEGAKPRMTDITLNVLSSLTLADLEEPGSKNVIRERLVTAYNQALGRKVAEQVYFSDFVIQ